MKYRKNWIYKFLCSQGPIWVKVGQTLSHRKDLFSPNVTKQLERLTYHTPPMPYKMLKAKLPRNVRINKKKILGAGCIAQTYMGIRNGRKVVVKITRPNIYKNAKKDLKIFHAIVSIASTISITVRNIASAIQFEHLDRIMLEQCDLRYEAKNARAFEKSYKNVSFVRIPHVYAVSRRVIVMDYLDGVSIEHFCSTVPQYADEIVSLYNVLYKKMVYADGMVHADMHPGNFTVAFDNQNQPILNVFDFGMVTMLNRSQVRELKKMFYATVLFDLDGFIWVLKQYNRRVPNGFIRAVKIQNRDILKATRIYKSAFQQCIESPNVENYKNIIKARKIIFSNKIGGCGPLFSLMYKYKMRLPSEIMSVMIDFDRVLRLSTKYQTKSQCFFRSMLRAVRYGILNYDPIILELEPLLDSIQVENKKWEL